MNWRMIRIKKIVKRRERLKKRNRSRRVRERIRNRRNLQEKRRQVKTRKNWKKSQWKRITAFILKMRLAQMGLRA